MIRLCSRRYAGPGCLAGILLAASAGVAADNAAGRCARAAGEYVAAIGSAERGLRPFEEQARRRWSYRPGARGREDGLALGEMTGAQRILAHRLIACGLSTQGYHKVTAIMQLDDIVAARIGEIAFQSAKPVRMGRLSYWLTVFGQPSSGEPWGWQLEGHHLALNFTVAGNRVSMTPAFLGADPAEVDRGELAGHRLLLTEAERAFELIASLDESQRAAAVISGEVPRGVFTRPGRADRLEAFEGLPVSAMNAAQRRLLWLVLDEYAGNLDPEPARDLVAAVLADGTERLYFAWMGPTTPDSAIYYRIHGPSILIEFDNAANIRSRGLEPDPHHVHSIMRAPGRDFGEDLLARHYAESPHHRLASEAVQ